RTQGLSWELSRISWKTLARRDRRRTRRLLGRGRLVEYLGKPCPSCGVAMSDINGPNDHRAPSRDHRIPKSRGGRNRADNIEICCRRCNGQKGNLTREEFKRRR